MLLNSEKRERRVQPDIKGQIYVKFALRTRLELRSIASEGLAWPYCI